MRISRCHNDLPKSTLMLVVCGRHQSLRKDLPVKQSAERKSCVLQHAPVFNNQVLLHDQMHTATTMLFPGITRTADMQAASAPGIFQYRCDYQDHYVAGMQARLVVTA
jgi:Multicopper oxidase